MPNQPVLLGLRDAMKRKVMRREHGDETSVRAGQGLCQRRAGGSLQGPRQGLGLHAQTPKGRPDASARRKTELPDRRDPSSTRSGSSNASSAM
jgi:hypothetical protein